MARVTMRGEPTLAGSLYELAPGQFDRVRALFAPLDFNLIISAVLDGANRGRVFVDDLTCPGSALLCSGEGNFLAGRADNAAFNRALSHLITTRIFNGETIREGEHQFDVRVASDDWLAQFDILLPGRPPFAVRRRHYVCTDLLQPDWQARVPPGFTVRRVDAALMAQPESAPYAFALEEMNSNWGSVTNFLANGLGFAMLYNEEPVCWCLADCISGDRIEVGILTVPLYRRRGLATLTVAALVEYCLASGFREVGWHCWEGNLGSIGVAEKVGFVLERRYKAYACLFDDAEHHANAGYIAIADGRCDEAHAELDIAFATGRAPNWAHYVRALAFATQGRYDEALDALSAAADRGWWSEERVDSPVFAPMQAMPGWHALRARMQDSR